jgi:hypothetical protein
MIAHPPLVSEVVFVAAQQVRAARPTKDGGARDYLLVGLVRCRLCGRRMDSHWVHGRAGYRCRHGYTSSRPPTPGRPKNVYVREDVLLTQLAAQHVPASGSRGVDDVRSKAAAVVSSIRDAAMVIVHNGQAWKLATTD